MILCDSNIIIKLMRGDLKIKQTLAHIQSENIALSIITHAEIYFGTKKDDIPAIRKLLEKFQICHIDKATSKIFNGLILNYSATHHIKIPDALIAASAIALNYELYTTNKKDFDFIPEIRFYRPKK